MQFRPNSASRSWQGSVPAPESLPPDLPGDLPSLPHSLRPLDFQYQRDRNCHDRESAHYAQSVPKSILKGAEVQGKVFVAGDSAEQEATAQQICDGETRQTRFEETASGRRSLSLDKRQHEEELQVKKAASQKELLLEREMDHKAAEVARSLSVDTKLLSPERQRIHRWISSSLFESCVGLVIVANSLTIGLEVQAATQIPSGCNERCLCNDSDLPCTPVPHWLVLIDYVFFVVYVLEFALRFFAYGVAVIRSRWVKFDAFLIISAICDIMFRQIDVSNQVVKQILLVRMLRLVRLARAVRLMVQFRTLWQLVQGLTNSMCTLMWTFFMLMILMYVFSVLGMDIINVDPDLPLDHPFNIAATDNFQDFVSAILTLLQCFTLDSIASVYRPLIQHQPLLLFYFMGVILIMAIALMNLVTAVMVNSALDQANDDKEVKRVFEAAQKRKQMVQLKEMFFDLDSDKSGELTVQELNEAPDFMMEQLKDIAGTEDIEGLFDMLDYDGGGSLDTGEFCEGVMKASTSDKPLELTRLVKQCSDILKYCKQLACADQEDTAADPKSSRHLEARLCKLDQKVDKMQLEMNQKVDKIQYDIGRIIEALST